MRHITEISATSPPAGSAPEHVICTDDFGTPSFVLTEDASGSPKRMVKPETPGFDLGAGGVRSERKR